MRRAIPDEVRRQAVELARRGLSDPEVARRVGVSVMSVCRWRRAAGVWKPIGRTPGKAGTRRRRRGDRVREEAVRRAMSGERVADVAADVGVTPATLRYWIRESARPPRPKPKPKPKRRPTPGAKGAPERRDMPPPLPLRPAPVARPSWMLSPERIAEIVGEVDRMMDKPLRRCAEEETRRRIRDCLRTAAPNRAVKKEKKGKTR